MVMPLGPLPPSFSVVANYQTEIAAANYPLIRLTTIKTNAKNKETDTLATTASWSICSTEAAAKFSAVAYYFGRKLNTELDVPIGLIVSAVNGSSCESWVTQTALKDEKKLNAYYRVSVGLLYNGMINPLKNLSIKGFIWYQGESNQQNDPDNYAALNAILIKDWRIAFGDDKLPFYFVQLPPVGQQNDNNALLGRYAKFREGQAKIRAIARTGMVIALDVGELHNHHPRNKRQIGERLALLALNKTYRKHKFNCVGPQYKSFSQNRDKITVRFIRKSAKGLATNNNAPINQCFFVQGADCVFRKAVATIEKNEIIISIPKNTPLPIQAVRYAVTDFPVTNLQNEDSLPMEPFRTDNYWNQ
jgi:sialate O-acetylesterase